MTEPGVIEIAVDLVPALQRLDSTDGPRCSLGLVRTWRYPSGGGPRFRAGHGAIRRHALRGARGGAGRLLSYSFGSGPFLTTITWRLEPSDAGTLLSLEHAGFDLDSEVGSKAFQGMGAGWPGILTRIEPALADLGERPAPVQRCTRRSCGGR